MFGNFILDLTNVSFHLQRISKPHKKMGRVNAESSFQVLGTYVSNLTTCVADAFNIFSFSCYFMFSGRNDLGRTD